MKRIVAITASPKKPSESRTTALVMDFAESVKARSASAETVYFHLSQMNVLPCKGCMSCTKTGSCILEDDMRKVRAQLKEADLVVFGSPVHFNHVSSIFQNFVERLLVDLHTFALLGKPFIPVVTTNGSGEQEAEKYLSKIGLLLGAIKVGSLCKLDNGEFNAGKYRQLITRVSGLLAGNSRVKPTLLNSLYFLSMKKILKENPQYFPFEVKVWTANDWFNRSYRQALSGLSGAQGE